MRDGDPRALAGLCEVRGPAVLAYCEVVAGRGAAADAAAADAFGSFRAGVAATGDLASLNPEALLISATRHAAARHAGAELPSPCDRVPALLAARADRSITLAEHDWLGEHLAGCWTCRAPVARFEAADKAYLDPPDDDDGARDHRGDHRGHGRGGTGPRVAPAPPPPIVAAAADPVAYEQPEPGPPAYTQSEPAPPAYAQPEPAPPAYAQPEPAPPAYEQPEPAGRTSRAGAGAAGVRAVRAGTAGIRAARAGAAGIRATRTGSAGAHAVCAGTDRVEQPGPVSTPRENPAPHDMPAAHAGAEIPTAHGDPVLASTAAPDQPTSVYEMPDVLAAPSQGASEEVAWVPSPLHAEPANAGAGKPRKRPSLQAVAEGAPRRCRDARRARRGRWRRQRAD